MTPRTNAATATRVNTIRADHDTPPGSATRSLDMANLLLHCMPRALAVTEVAGKVRALGVQADGLPIVAQTVTADAQLVRWVAFKFGSVIRPWIRPYRSTRVR